MNDSTLDTLTQRLDRLERENRRLKVAGTIVFLVLVAVGAMGQVLPKAVPKVVEAERFVLRDARGKMLATLGTDGLVLADQNGKFRAALGVGTDGSASLIFDDQNEKPRVTLGVLDDGTPHLALLDQNEKPRLALAVGTDGTPHLALFDQNKKPRLALDVGTSGPSVVLGDQNRDRAVLGHTELEGKATGTVEQRPASSLVLFDRDGKVIWRAP